MRRAVGGRLLTKTMSASSNDNDGTNKINVNDSSSGSGKKRVVVVGGGVAGLTAATTLVKSQKFEVVLLEADKRVGGRTQTLKFGDGLIENGAQWVHGEVYNSVFAQVNPLGLVDPTSDEKLAAACTFVTESGECLTEKSSERIINYLEKVHEGPDESNSRPDQSIGDWAEKLFWEVGKDNPVHPNKNVCHGALDWVHRFINSIDGCDNWYQSSCRGQQEYWSCEGNPIVPWKFPYSYSSFLNLLMHGIPSEYPNTNLDVPDWVKLDKEVTSINYSCEKEVTVKCADGTIYVCDHAICCVPLGVLKNQPKLFEPPLEAKKQQAIKYLGLGCVNKLHLQFHEKWWPSETVGFHFIWNDCDLIQDNHNLEIDDDSLLKINNEFPLWCRSILGFYTIASHPTTLMTWISGPAAKLVEKLDEDQVLTQLLKILRNFLGNSYNIPDPIDFAQSKWFCNPFARGSYSYRSVKAEEENIWSADLASPIVKNSKPVICFAGEACHMHFYSTVHGAHDTGLKEATRLINFHDNVTEELSPMFPFSAKMFDS